MLGNLVVLFSALLAVINKDDGMDSGLVGLSLAFALQVSCKLIH